MFEEFLSLLVDPFAGFMPSSSKFGQLDWIIMFTSELIADYMSCFFFFG